MTNTDPHDAESLDVPTSNPGEEVDRPHRAADDSEEIYFEGSPPIRGHIDRLLGFGLLGICCFLLPIIAKIMGWSWWPGAWLTLVFCLIGSALIFLPALLAKTIRFRISNYRIDYERGLISRTIDTLELWHVEDVHFYQSLFDRMLGVGSITIYSSDKTNPRLDLHGLPRPRELFNTLKQRVIAVKRQRGVLKLDM